MLLPCFVMSISQSKLGFPLACLYHVLADEFPLARCANMPYCELCTCSGYRLSSDDEGMLMMVAHVVVAGYLYSKLFMVSVSSFSSLQVLPHG